MSSTQQAGGRVLVTGGAGYKMSYLPIWGGGSQLVMRKL